LSASQGSGTYRCLILSWKLKFIYIPEVKRKSNKVCFSSYHPQHLLLMEAWYPFVLIKPPKIGFEVYRKNLDI